MWFYKFVRTASYALLKLFFIFISLESPPLFLWKRIAMSNFASFVRGGGGVTLSNSLAFLALILGGLLWKSLNHVLLCWVGVY